MRQDPITFTPKLTLIVDANRRPRIRTVDDAMTARIVLVPWRRVFSEAEQDRTLGERLREEGPAILRWAVDGSVTWQRDGLGIPDSIKAASRDYLETEDELGQFLAEFTVQEPGARVGSSALYQNFRSWQLHQGMREWSQKALATALTERGFQRVKARDGNQFDGLRLCEPEPIADDLD